MKIDKGVDINDYGPHGYKWEFIKNMEVGDSVLLTDETAKRLCASWDNKRARGEMIRALRRFGMNGKSRTVDEFGNVRVWRIK
jgi:hypothetical protein